MSNDPFSDILRMTEAKTILSGGVSAGGAWSLHLPACGQLFFSAILSGECWLRVDGHKKGTRLREGDVGLLSGRKGFVICSSLAVKPIALALRDTWSGDKTIGDGTGCRWLAGRVALDPSSGLLLTEALPSAIVVRASSPLAVSLRWIVREICEEQGSTMVGAGLVSAQLAQLFFVKILRAHLARQGYAPRGWLRAVGDPRLVHALRAMHQDPAANASLTDLAKVAGMSRTRFAVHFKSVVGVSPRAYLTAWRMQIAQRMLRDEGATVLELARTLGYASESAFSHAFKRVVGTAPRHFQRVATTPAPMSG